jgi:hypothetical protein
MVLWCRVADVPISHLWECLKLRNSAQTLVTPDDPVSESLSVAYSQPLHALDMQNLLACMHACLPATLSWQENRSKSERVGGTGEEGRL